MPNIIVVEPHPLFRLGLVQLLHDIVPGSTISGADYAQMNSHEAGETETDLTLLATTSFDSIHQLVASALTAYSPAAILLLADHDEMPVLAQGLPEFVSGYVSRHASPQVLQASVRLVLAGGTSFPISSDRLRDGKHNSRPQHASGTSPPTLLSIKPTAAHVVGHQLLTHPNILGKDSKAQAGQSVVQASSTHPEWEMLGLTPRQYEVLILLARGHSMKMVGRQLNISAATAKAHAEALYQRLDVHNRNAAVYTAVSRGATLGWPSITAATREAGAWASAATE